LQGLLLQIEVSEIVVAEADEPDAVVDFRDTEPLSRSTVEMLIFLRCRQMRPQAVTRMSRSWNG
jgi:hypothetical protein